ncbi:MULTISPECIES: SGNH family hydrolase [unclassified Roseitalea]|uniref:SGNH/GDSL hydrolase family protein n=1 Tax=unclassified Roseitalea TaxID=2639107 RepID=UPI00273D948C|nr:MULTISPECIES: SGNH family hydrolase [unclassified Roseitalea]
MAAVLIALVWPAPAQAQSGKNPNARTVLVVGDFIADGMARGLEEAFADRPTVVVETHIRGSSGFVRDDHYDWPGEIGRVLDEIEPDIVVVLIGSNDRQPMRIDGRREDALTDAWRAEYVSRVEAFIAQIREREALLVWTGSPPFRFRSMSADILALNELYRTAAEGASGYFVDIWDGFVDENGRFVDRGTDVKGQTVRLRNSDGINFTRAGYRKIAFYVERQLRQVLDDPSISFITSLGPENLPILKLPPLETEAELDRIDPIALSDPDLDGGSALLGNVEDLARNVDNPLQAKSVRRRLVENGIPPPARPGRAGNFTWPAGG